MVKRVVFIQNITLEGPGLLELFLKKRNIPYEIRDLYSKSALPDDFSEMGAAVILGGPMNVNEEEQFPFLAGEKQWIRRCLQDGIPLLGICLGAQLLATILGAAVYKNRQPEIGCKEVVLTESGRNSPLFVGIHSPCAVFQWHGDTFDLPDGCQHMAESSLCLHQSFSCENRAFGLQFHIEVTLDAAREWARTYLPGLRGDEEKAARQILEMSPSEWPESIQKTSDQLCDNFFLQIAKLGSGK